MSKKLTTEEFILKAKKIHGDKYDYSMVDYDGAENPISIICPEHGEFPQTPHKHGNAGHGCPSCGNQKMKDSQSLGKESFINRAIEIHGDKYDYSKIEYINAHVKVEIICLIDNHGAFPQTPNDHLYQKSGCPKCGGRLINNTEEFIEASILIHSEKYNYSKSVFKAAKSKVIIGCPFHGEFTQAAYNHSHGIGCPDCGNEIRSLGDTIHELELSGRDFDGCLYVLEISNEKEHFYKVGITRNLSRRYTGMLSLPYYWDVLLEANIGMVAAYKIEQDILSLYSKHQYYPKIRFAGETECLSINPLEHDERLKELYSYQKDL